MAIHNLPAFPGTNLNDLNLDWLIGEMKELEEEFKAWPHSPQVINDIWYVWNEQTETYESTGIPATGPQGEQGPQGPQGPQGEPGEFDPAVLEPLKNNISALNTEISNSSFIDLNLIPGFYIATNYNIGETIPDLTPIVSSTFSYCIIDAVAGDVFSIQGTGGTRPKVITFIDSLNVVLEQFPKTGTYVTGAVYTAPEGTAKVIINEALAGAHYAKMGAGIKESDTFSIGKTDVGFIGNWNRPECVYFKKLREKLYFAFTSHSGTKGIGEYDYATGITSKRTLARIKNADLHNDLAIHITSDGYIVCAYSTGHNDDNKIHVRRSISPECIDYFTEETLLVCGGLTSYAQLIVGSNKLYLFYRLYRNSGYAWAYRVSTDNGRYWSDETELIVSDAQYYCMFVNTMNSAMIRVLSYTNPAASPRDTNIRQSFFHTDNNTLYDADNSTVLGTNSVNKDNITILIPNDGNSNQRLLDAAKSPVGTPTILYATFTTNSNAVYKLRKGADTYTITDAGAPLISSAAYFLGGCFIGQNKMCVIHGNETDPASDIVQLYNIGSSSVSAGDVIKTEERTALNIRNFYPVSDGVKALMWLRGIYGATYTDFNTDGVMYLISENKFV